MSGGELGADIRFRPLEGGDAAELRAWFEDAELARRMSYPTAEWLAHVAGPAGRCWIALDGSGERIALIQVDRAGDGAGHIALAVRPALRGRGFGAAALAAFVAGPGRDYPMLEGSIAPDNAASLACARRCGFELSAELDEDGFVRATRIFERRA